MKFLQVILLLLAVPLLVVESSSLNDTSVSNNITRGSSISTSLDDSPSSYLLSPSGNFAFGFYRLPCTRSAPNCSDTYRVGIWLVKSPSKTLVWTANLNDFPYHKPSSIHLTNDGNLVLHIMPDNIQKPLIADVHEPVSSAVMHDDGNFVIYRSDSQIVWQSFDHPTDTLLGGQKLRPGDQLISGLYRLSVQQTNGLITIEDTSIRYDDPDDQEYKRVLSNVLKGSLSLPVVLSLDVTGNLYLVGADDVVLKYLYRNKNRNLKQKDDGTNNVKDDVYIYRATLDSAGHLNFYKESTVDGNNSRHHEKSSTLLRTWRPMSSNEKSLMAMLWIGIAGLICMFIGAIICIYRSFASKDHQNDF